MKKLYIFFFGMIAGAILAIIFFSHPKAKPELITSAGHLSGAVKISPDSAQNPALKTPKKTALALEVPVAGELVTDSSLGKVTTELKGVTTVTVGQDDLKVDTRFSGVAVMEVPAEKNWRVYVGVRSDWTNIYPVVGIGYQKVLGNFFYNIAGEIGRNKDNLAGEVKVAIGITF